MDMTGKLVDDPTKWQAPQSWAVDKPGEDPSAEYSSSDESVRGVGPGSRGSTLITSGTVNGNGNANVNGSTSSNHKTRHGKIKKPGLSKLNSTSYKLRVYRANGAWHVVTIDLTVTVEQLTPVLNEKLLLDPDREVHRLYLKERGRGK